MSMRLPETRLAAILGITRTTCTERNTHFVIIAGDEIDEIIKRSQRYLDTGYKLCTLTIYNITEPLPRRLFREVEELRAHMEALDKWVDTIPGRRGSGYA